LNSQAAIDNFQTTYGPCTNITGNLIIQGNDIENLDGLQNITSIGGEVFITSNNLLTEFCGLQTLLNTPNDGVISTDITGNASNPTVMDIQEGAACDRILPVPQNLALMPWGNLLVLSVLILGLTVGSFKWG